MKHDLTTQVERLLDAAAARHPEGVKVDELRREVLDQTVDLIRTMDRDLHAEAESLVLAVSRSTRKARRSRMVRDIEYIIDGFAENGDGAYVDPMLDLAYPIGTEDGQVKVLRFWTSDDFHTSVRMAYRKAAEVTAAAREHDEWMQAAVRSMHARGVLRFGEPTSEQVAS